MRTIRNTGLSPLLFSFVICGCLQLGLSQSTGGNLRVGINYGEAEPGGKKWFYFVFEFKHPNNKRIKLLETNRYQQWHYQIFFLNQINTIKNVPNPMEVFVSDNTGEVLLEISVFETHADYTSLIHTHSIKLKTVHGHSELGIVDNGISRNPTTNAPKFKYIRLSYSFTCRDPGTDQLCLCKDTNDAQGHFLCGAGGTKICLPGWSDPSQNCLIPGPCSSTPCKNNGLCTIIPGGNYRCDCLHGYWGPTCEESCASQPCQNGGTCEPDGTGYRCDCSIGFIGKNCDKPGCDASSGYPCSDEIKCRLLSTGVFACFCLPGYGGENCDDIDECQSGVKDLCLNGGTCRNTIGGYACDCPIEFAGSRCHERKSPCDYQIKCFANETCLDTGNSPRCVPVDKIVCKPETCNNGGTCIKKRYHYVCLCLPGFYGPTCNLPPNRGV